MIRPESPSDEADFSAQEPAGNEHSPSGCAWSSAAIRLLQGVVYSDENASLWDTVLRHQSILDDYFSKIGLLLVLDESDGMAYLRQAGDEESVPGQDNLPRLFRRVPLGYEATLLTVLLRDELRQFEEEDLQNERCVVSQHSLLELWRAFFPDQSDEVRLQRNLVASLRKLEELKFVRLFSQEPPAWELRRILKARVQLADLERLRDQLVLAAARRNPSTTSNVNTSTENEPLS